MSVVVYALWRSIVLRCAQAMRGCARAADSGWLLPVCTDSSTDTIANTSSPWLRLIAVFGFGFVKPSTLTEAHETEHEHEPKQCGRTFIRGYQRFGERTASTFNRIRHVSPKLGNHLQDVTTRRSWLTSLPPREPQISDLIIQNSVDVF
jgi:hypothetical protein